MRVPPRVLRTGEAERGGGELRRMGAGEELRGRGGEELGAGLCRRGGPQEGCWAGSKGAALVPTVQPRFQPCPRLPGTR